MAQLGRISRGTRASVPTGPLPSSCFFSRTPHRSGPKPTNSIAVEMTNVAPLSPPLTASLPSTDNVGGVGVGGSVTNDARTNSSSTVVATVAAI